jgi:hypothetical protein
LTIIYNAYLTRKERTYLIRTLITIFHEGKDLSGCSKDESEWKADPSIDRCPQEDWTVATISALYMLFSNLLLVNLVIAMFRYCRLLYGNCISGNRV